MPNQLAASCHIRYFVFKTWEMYSQNSSYSTAIAFEFADKFSVGRRCLDDSLPVFRNAHGNAKGIRDDYSQSMKRYSEYPSHKDHPEKPRKLIPTEKLSMVRV